jgi:predicted CDP-diglyceride synthetase/phosphatidate cytidylyltransferase
MGLMVSVFCISHVPALLTLDIRGYEGRGLLLIAYLVLVVQSSDVLQYVWGKLAGRRPVAPLVSPSKTWRPSSAASRRRPRSAPRSTGSRRSRRGRRR